jgi:hypothetical protein
VDCTSTPTCACMVAHGATVPNAFGCGGSLKCEDDGAGHITMICHYY